ncbi:MAG TPA: hypothetical protein VK489_13840 [Ferruginibacter sp.]|nr:hypothetical protein [Ferruginibacter sp.]
MQFSLQHWIRITLSNLLLVAFMGVILRYKIAFALPFVDQKHLQHGHSHFAFAGWITQALMVLLIAYLAGKAPANTTKKYRWILLANLITAYGMLVAFVIEGYGMFSLILSTILILVSYIFGISYWKDLNRLASKEVSHSWFKAAVLFNAVSSVGTFALAFMMITGAVHQNWYLAAEYFYLHFQYNGWFFFACMGLVTSKLLHNNISQRSLKQVYLFFATAMVPAYFLSVLWMNFSIWIYIIIVIAAFAQVAGWLKLLLVFKKNIPFLKQAFSPAARWLTGLSAIALSIKLLLQLGSVIPVLSDLSYGFRPIIIGYLHLVLLGVITLFILGFMVAEKNIRISKMAIAGIILFVSGIIINEVFLMMQGVMAMNYNTVPFMNELLFIAALIMLTGLLIINISQQIKNAK